MNNLLNHFWKNNLTLINSFKFISNSSNVFQNLILVQVLLAKKFSLNICCVKLACFVAKVCLRFHQFSFSARKTTFC